MVTGLSHITIAVSDLERSLHFYIDVIGLKGHVKWQSGAYLSAGNLWYCLSCGTPTKRDDYTHIAFNVSELEFDEAVLRIRSLGIEEWKINKSEGKSLYILDPDDHKLELHVGDLVSRLSSLEMNPYQDLVWL
ncbi:VOC family protein [Vibrio profundum]|uniref:VOC family protein n=1 Tax=Vibrio profundum TaxID=2910247 RepID=UPI003D0F2EFA